MTSRLFSLRQAIQTLGGEVVRSAIAYNLRRGRIDRRFKLTGPRGRWQTPGAVTRLDARPGGAAIRAERGHLELHFLAPEILRVRLHPAGTFPPVFSYALAQRDWPPVNVQLRDRDTAYTIASNQLVCRLDKASARLTFATTDRQTLSEDADGFSFREGEVRWSRHLPAGERCHGLGQRASGLNLRGQQVALWNKDPVTYGRGDDPCYFSIPFYLGVQGETAFGVLWDNPARGTADLGATQPDQMTFSTEAGDACLYIIAGPTVADVLRHYTMLTGTMPLPPLWTLGFHQCRWSYETEDEFRMLMHEFRTRRLPCDVLYFDIHYMDGYRCFTWDRQRFSVLPKLLGDMQAEGFKSVAIIDPGIKVDPGYTVYDDGVRQDVFLKYPDGKPVTAPVWPANCHFPDFTSARVRAWWSGYVEQLMQLGFAGLWNDMNEPALITLNDNNTLPDYIAHDWDGAGQTHVGGGHNLYGTLMARATREGVQKTHPDRRPFVMTRAAYAGAQRYTSSWTGDNRSTWDHVRLSLSMVLNLGLSGMPFTGPDVGGFAGEPDGELFARWMQAACLLPYYRVHSAAGTPRQEPWSFGEEVEAIARRMIELRYQLLPTLYSLFAQCAQDGTPPVRPLFMADPADEALHTCDDAYLVGNALLVAPILEPGAIRRELTLPRGAWYEWDTGKLIDGARTITVEAPLDRLPLYVRAGSVLPMWPVLQYVGEKPIEESRLRVFAGSGETTIYEDAGEGFAYQQGQYRWSYFTTRFMPNGQFSIEWRRAGQYQPPYQHVRVEVVGISAEPESVALDGRGAPIWYFEDGVVEFVVKPFNEARIIGRDPSTGGAQRTILHRPGQ